MILMNVRAEQLRCLELGGGKAYISLEIDFWDCLDNIAERRGTTVDGLATEICVDHDIDNFPATLRVFVLNYFQERSGWQPECQGDEFAEDRSRYGKSGKQRPH
jgi:predicted DNA-binding ribbon-helix-helix protein